MRRARGQRGMVTAETAVVLPFLVTIAFALVWMVSVGVTEVRLVDTAREAARMTARGDDPAFVRDAARTMAPDDARIDIRTVGNTTEVTVSVDAGIDLPMLGAVPTVKLRADAVSAREAGATS